MPFGRGADARNSQSRPLLGISRFMKMVANVIERVIKVVLELFGLSCVEFPLLGLNPRNSLKLLGFV